MQEINPQKIALVNALLKFYQSTSDVLDNSYKSDIVWFATGLTKTEFEECRDTAQEVFKSNLIFPDESYE